MGGDDIVVFIQHFQLQRQFAEGFFCGVFYKSFEFLNAAGVDNGVEVDVQAQFGDFIGKRTVIQKKLQFVAQILADSQWADLVDAVQCQPSVMKLPVIVLGVPIVCTIVREGIDGTFYRIDIFECPVF